MDKPARTRVADYIERAMEESRREGGDDGSKEGSRQQVCTSYQDDHHTETHEVNSV